MKKLFKKAITFSLSALMAAGLLFTYQPTNVQAASLKIRYSSKTRTYTGKQLTSVYNKKSISTVPGLQINGINMIPYYNVLVKNGPKVKRSYNSKSGKLTLTYGSKRVTVYKNKKTSYVNGKKKTLPTAPVTVKYYGANKTYILVPANFVITNLGLNYSYISYTNKIHINKTSTSYLYSSNTTTSYNKSQSSYISAQKKQLSKYSGSTINYSKYIPVSTDPTHNYQFLRLNVFRTVKTSTYGSLLNKKVSSKSVLRNKGSVLISAAKSYNIDPVYLLCQTILETGYGTSTLSQGKSITTVVSGSSVVKDSKGNVTGFKKVNGKYITKKISSKKVYNLYGIKAYDDAAQLCGFSYAYYMGWTSVDKAIKGAAKYVSQEYINNSTYKQNTLYKYRFNPNTANLWHQYATDPGYAQKIGSLMYSQYRSAYATGNVMTYDKPKFK
ncbi:MAG: glucosaminidase domain-containing protein [Anaerostipes sp.]|nr:glucosaminidase domain-containing protein [Anaerostipes sp.]